MGNLGIVLGGGESSCLRILRIGGQRRSVMSKKLYGSTKQTSSHVRQFISLLLVM